eukprot:2504245-Rhodomonas_salina.5
MARDPCSGIQLKLVIALADVDAHRLSEVYAESRSQEAKHVTSYALICAAGSNSTLRLAPRVLCNLSEADRVRLCASQCRCSASSSRTRRQR